MMRARARAMWSRTMSSKRPILIVEDDAALRGVLAEQLVETGDFHPVEAASLDQATQLLDDVEIGFDLIILDVNLPDGDGCGFCAHMRRQGHKMPIIMLTGSSAEADVVRGLDAGANDYIIKPFRMNELIARMVRGAEPGAPAHFSLAPARLAAILCECAAAPAPFWVKPPRARGSAG